MVFVCLKLYYIVHIYRFIGARIKTSKFKILNAIVVIYYVDIVMYIYTILYSTQYNTIVYTIYSIQ